MRESEGSEELMFEVHAFIVRVDCIYKITCDFIFHWNTLRVDREVHTLAHVKLSP